MSSFAASKAFGPREVSRAGEEVLLRPDEVPDVPRSVGHQVPDSQAAVSDDPAHEGRDPHRVLGECNQSWRSSERDSTEDARSDGAAAAKAPQSSRTIDAPPIAAGS